MAASFPSSLPQVFEREGYSETDQDFVSVFQPRSGPPKTRPEFTCSFRSVIGRITIDSTQKVAFEDWYENTINSGQDRFNAQLASADGTIELYLFNPQKPVPYDLSQEGDNIVLTMDLLIVPQ